MKEREKQMTGGHLIKLLHHKKTDRGMLLIPEASRCIRRYEIHELIVTDERGLVGGSRVDRVGFLGFAEFSRAGVVEVGDELWIDGQMMGIVVGFDDCHFPNHYNIIVEAPSLLTADDLALRVGEAVLISPPKSRAVGAVESEAPVTVIVGFGRCGRLLHLPSIARVRLQLFGRAVDTEIFAFDRFLNNDSDEIANAIRQCTWIDDLGAVPRSARSCAIVHICTPPSCRSEVIESAAKLGMRRFILEKPMAQAAEELEAICNLKRKYQLEIFVVSNWTSSVLTYALKERLKEKADGISHLIVRQVKSRISRSRLNSNHYSAFDVELPHMVALACFFGGPSIRLCNASSWDLTIGGEPIRNMGGGEIVLEMVNGAHIYLHADHMAPFRERSVEIYFTDGLRLKGYYPCVSADLYSQLHEYDAAGLLINREFFEDDTLTCFFIEVYGYLMGSHTGPPSDFDFSVRVCSLLNEAKRQSTQLAQRSTLI